MKLGLRFFISWIASALVMFALFYTWHGIFLNDFKRINFPLSWFVTFAAVTYLLLSAGIYLLFESHLLKKIRGVFLKGIICGALAGFSFFMAATIIHISLTRQLSMQHLLIDCVWQISEQIVGAMVVVAVKGLVHDHHLESA